MPHTRTVQTGLGKDGIDDLAALVRRFMAACQVAGAVLGSLPRATYCQQA
jgi:hypothetical protein